MLIKLHIKKSDGESAGKVIKEECKITSINDFEYDMERGIFGHAGLSHWVGLNTSDAKKIITEFNSLGFDKEMSSLSLLEKKMRINEKQQKLKDINNRLIKFLEETK